MSMVNNLNSCIEIHFRNYEKESKKDPERIMQEFKEKEMRSKYNYATLKCVKNLVNISIKLKSLRRETRKPQLLEYIQRANNWILMNRVRAFDDNEPIFAGIYIPFTPGKDEESNSNFVVGILEESYAIFSTQKRAPYKIVFETIEYFFG